jgi:hypothetical protein
MMRKVNNEIVVSLETHTIHCQTKDSALSVSSGSHSQADTPSLHKLN